MSLYEARKELAAMSPMTKVVLLLVFAVVLWSVGAPTYLKFADAVQLSNVSDTLTNSNLGVAAVQTIQFTATAPIALGNTIDVQFDPAGSAFTEQYAGLSTTTDFALSTNSHTYTIVNSCSSTDQATVSAVFNNGSDEHVTFTICATSPDAIATSSVVTLQIGTTSAPLISNPGVAGSYVIRLGGTMPDSGDTMVAVLQNVTVTASVNTSFTFTVSGMATSTAGINGITTTGSSTPTTLPFGTLSTVASSTLGQTLSVATNARNGFAVTVQENQPLTSSNGAIIPLFSNGATTSAPIAWVAPSNILNQPNTYGHFGVSSDDSDLNSGEFTGAKYAGNINTPRQVFANNGPADGTTQNDGIAHVFYTIQIGTLQPAGNDYTNTLTYVATPTF